MLQSPNLDRQFQSFLIFRIDDVSGPDNIFNGVKTGNPLELTRAPRKGGLRSLQHTANSKIILSQCLNLNGSLRKAKQGVQPALSGGICRSPRQRVIRSPQRNVTSRTAPYSCCKWVLYVHSIQWDNADCGLVRVPICRWLTATALWCLYYHAGG